MSSSVPQEPLTHVRLIGPALFAELVGLLSKGRHIALLGPRNSGKALVLEEVQAVASRRPAAQRPDVVRLIWSAFERLKGASIVQIVAKQMGVRPPKSVQGSSLSGLLLDVYRRRVEENPRPVWLLVQDIVGFPALFARGILRSLSVVAGDTSLREHLAALVSGGADFAPLTYASDSLYRNAEHFLVQAMDKQYAKSFFLRRRENQQRSTAEAVAGAKADLTKHITTEGFDLLYDETAGSTFFLQEITLSACRHPFTSVYRDIPSRWERKHVVEIVEDFLQDHMPRDHFVELAYSDVERIPEEFDLLLRVVREGDGVVPISEATPPVSVLNGIVSRAPDGKAAISSPLWRKFLKWKYTARCVADVYALQGRWDLAWKTYASIPIAYWDRPVAGTSHRRMLRVLHDLQDVLFDLIPFGCEKIAAMALTGLCYLLRFDSAVLMDRVSRRILHSVGKVHAGQGFVAPPERALRIDDTVVLDVSRMRLWARPVDGCHGRSGEDPLLYLARGEVGRDIDASEQDLLRSLFARFWAAYSRAADLEYRMTTEALVTRHQSVINAIVKVISEDPPDIGPVIRAAARSLVHDGHYLRVLISLVDPKREHIQGVASSCHEQAQDFDYGTNYRLNDQDILKEDRDIQPWVVEEKMLVTVPDASDPTQLNPRTNATQANRLGMRSITVVPMMYGEKVMGTIHLERLDRKSPSEKEEKLIEALANQLAVLFHAAERLTLLHQALSQSSDKIRIVDPNKRILFLSRATAKELSRKPGWQDEPPRCDCRRKKAGKRCLIDELGAEPRGHHYDLLHTKETLEAGDLLTVAIDDFRSRLRGHFRGADGRIGYMERAHDLSAMYRLLIVIETWFEGATTDVSSMAKLILSYFENHFAWVRFYEVQREKTGLEVLVGVEEKSEGQKSREHALLFERGGIRYPRLPAPGQPWHILLETDEAMALYEEDVDLPKGQTVMAGDLRGFPRFLTNDVRDRDSLEKRDRRWIEARLAVGTHLLGKLTMSYPENLPAERWEILRTAVLGASVALLQVVRRREGEEAVAAAVQLAANQVSHQLTNKISPAETYIVHGLDKMDNDPLGARSNITSALDALREARAILADFGRYTSDAPPPDLRYVPVASVAAHVHERLVAKYGLEVVSESAGCGPGVSIEVSLSNVCEVFDLLADNSLLHSGRSRHDLRLTITCSVGDAPPGSGLGRCVRLAMTDNGSGIPVDLKERIFEPYVSTSSIGTGLGLAVARKVVARQRGVIAEEGESGKGACFALYFPVRAGEGGQHHE